MFDAVRTDGSRGKEMLPLRRKDQMDAIQLRSRRTRVQSSRLIRRKLNIKILINTISRRKILASFDIQQLIVALEVMYFTQV